MPDLLIEIGCEELPAAACREAERQLPELLTRSLSEAGLESRDARIHVGAAAAGGDRERAAAARCRRDASSAARAPTPRRRPGPGSRESTGWQWTSWSSARASCGPSASGRAAPAIELVPDAVHRIVAGLQFAKTMRWPGGRFSRPIRWLVVKLDDEVVEMELAGVASGGESRGHRVAGCSPGRLGRELPG